MAPRDVHLHQLNNGPQVEEEILPFTSEVEEATADIYKRLKASPRVGPGLDAIWRSAAPYIHAINGMKKELGAVVLAHKYMTPFIYEGIADHQGDSLMLAQQAARVKEPVIVQCGVHFMAETSKILSPEKTVLLGDHRAGCSLAESISAEQLRDFKKKHGEHLPVVTYVNSGADVKAVSDITCTSSNAALIVRAIAEEFNTNTVLMTPDAHLAANVAKEVADDGIKIIPWMGACMVHEQFTVADVRKARAAGNIVIAHPECPKEVIDEVMSDPDTGIVGSTKKIHDTVRAMIAKNSGAAPLQFATLTECAMSDDLSVEFPNDAEFLGACHYCPHMKRIDLPNTFYAMRSMLDGYQDERAQFEVTVPEEFIAPARRAIEKMIAISERDQALRL